MAKSSIKNIKFQHAAHKIKILTLAGLMTASALNANAAESAPKAKTETVAKKATKPSLTKVYKINNRQDFDKLWNDAKPLCVPVLILSENWRVDFHHDKGLKKTPNSVCAGLYYYPKNGDFHSKTWIKTSQYFINYQNTHKGKSPKNRTPQNIRDGIYGWGESMENGRHLESLYSALKGSEITINEFAALYSHFFHTCNLKAAKKFAAINNSKKIKDKPLACAQALLDSDPVSLAGQKSRFMHEALVCLNEDNYCSDIFSLCVDCHLGTSINACPGQFENVNNNKLTHAKAKIIKDRICNRTVRGGKQIKALCKQINDKNIMAFCVTTQNSKSLDERDAIYQKALKAYNSKDYKTAKKLFQQVMAKHGEGPDLWNDMAITYYNLGEYTNCIEMCRKVLNSGENKEYAKACYNAGKAYEEQGNYAKALQNYEKALKYYNSYGIADKSSSVDYKTIYTKAINRVTSRVQTTKQSGKTSQKSTGKNKQKKSTMFFLATMAVARKRNGNIRAKNPPRKDLHSR